MYRANLFMRYQASYQRVEAENNGGAGKRKYQIWGLGGGGRK